MKAVSLKIRKQWDYYDRLSEIAVGGQGVILRVSEKDKPWI